MTNLNRPDTDFPIRVDREPSTLDDGHRTGTGVSSELISEAVIASYIHDISTRHSSGTARRRGRRSRDGDVA